MPPRSRRSGTTRGGVRAKVPGNLVTYRRRVADLLADPANLRVHPERNIRAIQAALSEFGQQKPIVVDSKDIVIAGNGTLEAADRLGWEEIDVVVSTLDALRARAYGIADNRTAEFASWDMQALAESLPAVDVTLLPAVGFTQAEVDKIVGKLTPDTGADDPPPFTGRTTKTLFLTFDESVHEWLMDVIAGFRERRGITNNSDAVVALVAAATKKKPPVSE